MCGNGRINCGIRGSAWWNEDYEIWMIRKKCLIEGESFEDRGEWMAERKTGLKNKIKY